RRLGTVHDHGRRTSDVLLTVGVLESASTVRECDTVGEAEDRATERLARDLRDEVREANLAHTGHERRVEVRASLLSDSEELVVRESGSTRRLNLGREQE